MMPTDSSQIKLQQMLADTSGSFHRTSNALRHNTNTLVAVTGQLRPVVASASQEATTSHNKTFSDLIMASRDYIGALDAIYRVTRILSQSEEMLDYKVTYRLEESLQLLIVETCMNCMASHEISRQRGWTIEQLLTTDESLPNVKFPDTKCENMPRVEVTWWNETILCIRCPYCGNDHEHIFASIYVDVVRLATCDTSRQEKYACVFPDTNSYELEKDTKSFRTAGATRCAVAGIIPVCRFELHGMMYPAQLYLDLGSVSTLGVLAYNGKEDFFVFDVISTSENDTGATSVNLRADSILNSFSYAISLVIETGNQSGAAVSCSLTLVDPDCLGIDLETRRNLFGSVEASRLRRLCPTSLHAREFSLDDDILSKLETLQISSGHGKAEGDFVSPINSDRKSQAIALTPKPEADYLFSTRPGYVDIYQKVKSVRVENVWKTIARLERGFKFEAIDAKSGWIHGGTAQTIVSGTDRTEDVLKLAKCIGYELPDDGKDQGQSGRFNACHAEKQLTAEFLRRHMFLPYEVGYVDHGHIRSALREIGNLREGLRDIEPRNELWNMFTSAPERGLRSATIFVSNQPCLDCENFRQALNEYFDVAIKFRYCGDDV